MITQNRGEWSELYVFLKLLGDGVLYAADGDLNKIDNLFYPLIAIIRNENAKIKHYKNNATKINIIDETGELLLALPSEAFKTKAELLLNAIKTSKETTFNVPEIENFMSTIFCTKVKADSVDKSDITVVLHDNKTYKDAEFGFSIKSRLGHPSTLLNPGKTTNFIYEINGKLSKEQIDEINSINTSSKILDRIKKIYDCNCELEFSSMENNNFKCNLQMIDSSLPCIVAEYLLQHYRNNGNYISEITTKVNEVNPCNFDKNSPHNYYEYKIKNFLTDVALGMTPAKPWNGKFQATGGYIIVREDGEIFCYHVYNRNNFQEYLFKQTRIDTPSTTKFDFGSIYSANGRNYIKLNLQIRFI